MKLGIVGMGTVGKATARCFLEHVEEVRCHDRIGQLSTHDIFDVLNCDLVMLCLPEAEIDGWFYANTADSLFGRMRKYVIRSTVPVGFTARMAESHRLSFVAHWPEFLTERCSLTDAQIPARNIIGTPDAVNRCSVSLYDLLYNRFPSVPILKMTSNESETVKLMTNAFFATKVSLFNEFRAFCDESGLNWLTVLNGILTDGRISYNHINVPGPDGQRGFGGKCLPKDLDTLLECMAAAEAPRYILRAVKHRNEVLDRPEGK